MSIYPQTIAEFIGTFIIIFSSAAGPIVNQKYAGAETLIGNAACAGLAVMVAVLSTGHISGAHLNPAVTVAFTALRHFPLVQVPMYILAQLAGSLSAAFLLKWAYHPFMSGGVTAGNVGVAETFVLEFVATFFLMFVITAVATDTRAVILLLFIFIFKIKAKYISWWITPLFVAEFDNRWESWRE